MRRQAQILVVEDDQSILQILTLLLTDEGFSVLPASDCESALEIVHETRPDLVVLDVRLPVMDGWSFLDIYHQSPGPHAPVIVTSAAFGTVERAAQHGAAAFLPKPFDLDHFLALVSQHLSSVRPQASHETAPASPQLPAA